MKDRNESCHKNDRSGRIDAEVKQAWEEEEEEGLI
jgi:hypothetical protein